MLKYFKCSHILLGSLFHCQDVLVWSCQYVSYCVNMRQRIWSPALNFWTISSQYHRWAIESLTFGLMSYRAQVKFWKKAAFFWCTIQRLGQNYRGKEGFGMHVQASVCQDLIFLHCRGRCWILLNPITDVIHSRCFAAADFWHVANRCSRAWMIWATGRADMDEIDAHMMRGRYVNMMPIIRK